MSHHDEKLSSLLLHLAADFISKEAGRSTLITPLRVSLGKEAKTAVIFVGVFPDKDTDHALTYLNRVKDDFRAYIKAQSRISRLPYISFELDHGERNRQHLDELSSQIDKG